jgi:hypothetical protein
LDALSKAMLTLLLAAAKQQLDQHGDIRIPAEVQYRGAIRRHRQLTPGVLAALVLADPAVNACVQATAGMYGIAMQPADDAALMTAADRAEQLRSKLATIESKLRAGAREARSLHAAPDQPGPPGPIPDRSPADVSTPSPAGHTSAQVGPHEQRNMEMTNHQLPDAGQALVALAGGDPAVAAEVDRVRRPDGALCAADLTAYRKDKDGPLQALRILLEDEAQRVSVWSGSGFGLLQKRSASKQVEQVCIEQGANAAVNWALANSTNGNLDVTVLRMMYKSTLDGSFGPALQSILEKSLRKWKRS